MKMKKPTINLADLDVQKKIYYYSKKYKYRPIATLTDRELKYKKIIINNFSF